MSVAVSATGTQAGGIVGTNSGTIRDCSSDVTVEATSYAGGIAGLEHLTKPDK